MRSKGCARSWLTSSAPKKLAYSAWIGEAATFEAFWSFGIDLEEYDLLRALGNAGLRSVMGGECHVELAAARTLRRHGQGAGIYSDPRVGNQTIAILAILRLFRRSSPSTSADMELFKLLSDEAAEPLFGRQRAFEV